MGVQGLWKVIDKFGRNISYEDLNGATAAVDVSVWLNIATKGMRNVDGSKIANAHLLYIFRRICRMLELGMKPIFVFDGEAPLVKQKTRKKRKQRQQDRQNIRDEKYRKIIVNNLVSEELNVDNSNEKGKKIVNPFKNTSQTITYRDPFDLPQRDYLKNIQGFNDFSKNKQDNNDDIDNLYHVNNEEMTDLLEGNKNDVNFNVLGDNFDHLPLCDQHKLLNEARESFKYDLNVGFTAKEKIDNISKYQFDRLIKKAKITQKLNEVEKKLRQNNLTQLTDKYIYDSNYKNIDRNKIISGNRLASDEHSYFLLLEQEGYIAPHNHNHNHSKDNDLDSDNVQVNDSKLKSMSFAKRKLPMFKKESVKKFKSTWKLVKTNLSDEELPTETSFDNKLLQPIVKPYKKEKIQEERKSESSDFQYIKTPIKNEIVNVINTDVSFETVSNEPTKEDIVFSTMIDNNVSHKIAIDKVKELLNRETESKIKIEIKRNINEENINEIKLANRIDNNDKSKDEFMKPKDEITVDKTFPSLKTEHISNTLQKDTTSLVEELNKIDRQSSSITERIIRDCIELFNSFGIPWIVAPGEAEAQCAHLNITSKCDFVLTNDGDALLFGAKRVLKGFLHQVGDIKRKSTSSTKQLSSNYGRMFGSCSLPLTRTDLIAFALLSGCDYTSGVAKIGPTKAYSIVTQFSTDDNALDTLESFKNAFDGEEKEPPILKQLKNVSLPESFPNRAIVQSFMQPTIEDYSDQSFAWGGINKNSLQEFCKEKFDWDSKKLDSALFSVEKSKKILNDERKITHWFPVYKPN